MEASGADAAANHQATPDGAPGTEFPASGSLGGPEAASYAEAHARHRWRRRFTVLTAIVTVIAAALILPPLVNIGRYKHRVVALMTQSLGRPVRISNVGMRLLPTPGFVIQDLSVSEDPRFGTEPVLSAGSVVAGVNLFSLWRGKLEISRISVDDASLNLVRASDGRWNVDSLMIGVQPALTGQSQPGKPVPRSYAHFPYLEATDSRVNVKFGDEKMPFALTATDLSLWQDAPGQWRFRLKGQPARTDIPMSSADTGELRAEGSLRSAPVLRDMPISLQVEWRELQLGQLSRLVLGSDSGWRGDVTADIEVHGTAENAQTRERLRVLGIRREESAPQTVLNFETNCTLRYQHSRRAVQNLACNTDSGGGQLHLRAELPGPGGAPQGSLEVHDVSLQAALDLVRVIRGGFASDLSVGGKLNGSLSYEGTPATLAQTPTLVANSRPRRRQTPAAQLTEALPLRGQLFADSMRIEGGGLKEPLSVPRMTWAPEVLPASGAISTTGAPAPGTLVLAAHFSLPLGPARASTAAESQASGSRTTAPVTDATRDQPADAKPSEHQPSGSPQPDKSSRDSESEAPRAEAQILAVQLGLGLHGFQADVTGSASIARLRELGYALGMPHLEAADRLSGNSADLTLRASGPWLPSGELESESSVAEQVTRPGSALQTRAASQRPLRRTVVLPQLPAAPRADSVNATVSIPRAIWSPAYLPSPVNLSHASLDVSGETLAFASDFSIGGKEPARTSSEDSVEDSEASPVASPVRGAIILSAPVNCTGANCAAQAQIHFGALDAAALQAALRTQQSRGFFAPLIDRMRPAAPIKLPDCRLSVDAHLLGLGPLVLQSPSAKLHAVGGNLLVDSWQATIFGGNAAGTGQIAWTDGKPVYSLEGEFAQVNGSALGLLLGSKWSGGRLSGKGQIKLSGSAARDLAASAAGQVQFDWRNGTNPLPATGPGPAIDNVDKFNDWSGIATLQGGKVVLGENTMLKGAQKSALTGAIPFGGPARLTMAPAPAKVAAGAATPVK